MSSLPRSADDAAGSPQVTLPTPNADVRTLLAVQRTVDALDQAALESRRRLTVPLARQVLVAAGIVTQPQSLVPTDDP